MSDSEGVSGPGPLSRRGSLQRAQRREAKSPYGGKPESTGLTDSGVDGGFDEEVVAAGSVKRTMSTFRKAALSAISLSHGNKTASPQEITLWKDKANDVLGITFDVPEDTLLKGVVVSKLQEGSLIAKSKKLKVGDVVHAINGRPVVTPPEALALLQDIKGVIQLVITSVGAKPRARDSTADTERSTSLLSSALSYRPGSSRSKAKTDAAGTSAAAADEADSSNTTVVVSCSQLILESKKVVGSASGLDAQLDELYKALKAKQIESQRALRQLIELVGQTAVEQAGLVIANEQQGNLPKGWVEYYDQQSSKHYYYNVHTKTTTWMKPKKVQPPQPPQPKLLPQPQPQPQPQRSSCPSSATAPVKDEGRGGGGDDDEWDKEVEEEDEVQSGRASGRDTSRSQIISDEVAEAIEALSTKRKMIETVQIECSLAPRHGIAGLQSVSL